MFVVLVLMESFVFSPLHWFLSTVLPHSRGPELNFISGTEAPLLHGSSLSRSVGAALVGMVRGSFACLYPLICMEASININP